MGTIVELFIPLLPPAGGKAKVRGADDAVCGAAHITLPSAIAPGPLPLPLKGLIITHK
jgi:hypothetical protein